MSRQDPSTVEVKNLCKTYSTGLPAVSNVTFGIKENQVLGLLGPNGAGKSSTFNVLTMDMARSYGVVKLLGEDISQFDTTKHGKKLGLCA